MSTNPDNRPIRVIDIKTGEAGVVMITKGPARKAYSLWKGGQAVDSRQFDRAAHARILVENTDEQDAGACWPEEIDGERLWVTEHGRKLRESDNQEWD